MPSQVLRCYCLNTAAPRLAPPKPHHPTTAPRTTTPARNTQHHNRIAGGRMHPLTAQAQPMHAAYFRGPARSAASSIRETVQAMLPHHPRSHCLHTPPPLGTPLASPTDARSVRLRSSDVSCVILPRLGASDAAPAAPIPFSAYTAAPRNAACKPHHPLQPRAQPLQPTASSMHSRRSQAPTHSAAAANVRSIPLRSSDFSCVILPRLGASDAAP
jgi:hypothetical protein